MISQFKAYMSLEKLLFICFPVKHDTNMCTYEKSNLQVTKKQLVTDFLMPSGT